MSEQGFIRLQGVAKSWGSSVGVEHIDLEIGRGEFTVLLGPSGCGKSTTLRLIAGLELPNSGTLTIGGRDVTHLPPSRRGLSMVFQSYALFPHLDVAENIVFGLRVRRVPAEPSAASGWPRRCASPGSRASRRASPPSCPAASASAWRSPAPSSPAIRCA
jgi:sn-glycerol 3-phosphate transport system ATP-binding protein